MSRNASIAISAAAVVATCAFIFLMSSRSGGESGALSRLFVDYLIQFLISGYDQMSPHEQLALYDAIHFAVRKLAHFSEFALLGALAANFLVRLAHAKATIRPPSTEYVRDLSIDECLPSRPQSTIRRLALITNASTADSAIFNPYVIAWAFSVVYATSDEIHQLFVPGRACMPFDVLIDASGALVGVAIFALAIKLFAKLR